MNKHINLKQKHQCKDACLYDNFHPTSTCKLCVHDESNGSCFCGKVSYTTDDENENDD